MGPPDPKILLVLRRRQRLPERVNKMTFFSIFMVSMMMASTVPAAPTDNYLDKINQLEYEDILNHLDGNPLRDPDLLERLRQYEQLKDAMRAFVSVPTDVDDLQVDDDDADAVDVAKRMQEAIDKEDDWLYDPDAPYGLSPFEDQMLSSRRRLYPRLEDSGEEVKEEGDNGIDRGQEEQELRLQMSKKDAESMRFAADPALTVHQLSSDPKIAFRKTPEDKEEKTEVGRLQAFENLVKANKREEKFQPEDESSLRSLKEAIKMKKKRGRNWNSDK